MLDLDLVRTFVAVVDAGGFTRAAQRINRTQSTVSQQIGRLEADLGHALLRRDRTGGRVVPTERGEILLGYARRLLGLSAEAREALHHPGIGATVRLGVTEDFAGPRLTALLASFARAHPLIRLDTTSAWSLGLERLVAEGALDLALVKRDAQAGRCLARWPETLVWVAGPEADLDRDPIPVALFPQGCLYRRHLVEAIEALGRPWRIAFAGQGLAGVQAAIASGVGIGLLPVGAVQAGHRRIGPNDHAAGGGPGLALPDPPPTELALVARDGHRPQAVGHLVEHLATRVGIEPA